MSGGTPRSVMTESNKPKDPLQRRSPRFSSPLQANFESDKKMAAASDAVKRRITVRKIAPRKTTAHSENDKENTPRRSEMRVSQELKQKVSTPGPTADQGSSAEKKKRFSSPLHDNKETNQKMATASDAVKRRITVKKIAPRKTTAPSENDKENTPSRRETRASQGLKQKVSTPSPTADQGSSSAEKKKRKAAMPSPILPATPPPPRPQQEPAVDAADAVWSQKVRRSYSRLSDRSLNSSPESRDTLFGFEKLQTPVVMHSVRHCRTGLEGSLTGLSSFTSLLEADDGGAAVVPEPDLNIPGVVVVKEKRRRKKVQQIGTTEMDALVAEMNAVFDEAEDFELVVE